MQLDISRSHTNPIQNRGIANEDSKDIQQVVTLIHRTPKISVQKLLRKYNDEEMVILDYSKYAYMVTETSIKQPSGLYHAIFFRDNEDVNSYGVFSRINLNDFMLYDECMIMATSTVPIKRIPLNTRKNGFQISHLFYDKYIDKPPVVGFLENYVMKPLRANMIVEDIYTKKLTKYNITAEFLEEYIGHVIPITRNTNDKTLIGPTSFSIINKIQNSINVLYTPLWTGALISNPTDTIDPYSSTYITQNKPGIMMYTPQTMDEPVIHSNIGTALLFTDSTIVNVATFREDEGSDHMVWFEYAKYYRHELFPEDTRFYKLIGALGGTIYNRYLNFIHNTYYSCTGEGGIVGKGPVRLLYPAIASVNEDGTLYYYSTENWRNNYCYGLQIDTKDDDGNLMDGCGVVAGGGPVPMFHTEDDKVTDDDELTPDTYWYVSIVNTLGIRDNDKHKATDCGTYLLRTFGDLKKLAVISDNGDAYVNKPSYGRINPYIFTTNMVPVRWPKI